MQNIDINNVKLYINNICQYNVNINEQDIHIKETDKKLIYKGILINDEGKKMTFKIVIERNRKINKKVIVQQRYIIQSNKGTIGRDIITGTNDFEEAKNIMMSINKLTKKHVVILDTELNEFIDI